MKVSELPQQHHLLPLSARLGPFAGFSGTRNRQALIYERLRPITDQRPGRHPRRFHSLREVAAYFGVSLWTAGAVYRRLEREGRLVRHRGSCTVVPARASASPQRSVRGVVTLPVWLPGFILIPDIRVLVMQLEERLRAADFVADVVFYREEEKRAPSFADRIVAHQPDWVVWFMPGEDDHGTISSINDAGIRTLLITDRPVRSRLPQHVIRWRQGLEQALSSWRKQGVRRLLVPVGARRLTSCTHALEPLAGALRFVMQDVALRDERMSDYIARLLAYPNAGIVFDDDIWQARLALQWPREFTRVLSHPHVLLTRSIPIDAQVLGSTRTGALEMPWDRIISSVVDDLQTGALFRLGHDRVFEARWQPAVAAATLARLFAYEGY